MGHLAHPPVPFKRSLDYSFTFPVQEFRLKSGDADESGRTLIRPDELSRPTAPRSRGRPI